MLKLVSSAAALQADRAAETELGYPSWMLMEEAGIRLQDALERLTGVPESARGVTAYLVGSGNNGGDALVMARQAFLRQTQSVAIIEVTAPSSPTCLWQSQVTQALGIRKAVWPSAEAQSILAEAALWVDGLWGTGLKGSLRPAQAGVLRDLEAWREEHQRRCAAVDVPSGLWEGYAPGDPVLRARWTLAPGWLKDFGFYPWARDCLGLPVAVPMAFPRPAAPTAQLVQADDLESLLPRVRPSDHKGTRGHVALIGAAEGMTGALVLASRSAAAAGAGLVSLGIDEPLIPLVAPQVPAFQVRLPGDLMRRLSRFDAVVVGPGWGRGEDRLALLAELWASDRPLVIDADGLAVWAALAPGRRSAPVILTPHPGEFQKLIPGSVNWVADAQTLARERGVTVVLKGAVTWILAPDGRRAVWDGANPALGTGGSGDCLAGVLGAFLARGMDGFEAAQTGVVLHGVAGQDLADREGWFTADRLPGALAQRALTCRTGAGPL